jgi:hypothetical protein
MASGGILLAVALEWAVERLLQVVFVEDASATQLLDGVLDVLCPSVAKACRRLLDAEAEGLERHVSTPTELLDQLTQLGWTSRCCASEERSDVDAQALRAIVIRSERHHQIAIVLQPFLFSGAQQIDELGLQKARIAGAQQLRHVIEQHRAPIYPKRPQ